MAKELDPRLHQFHLGDTQRESDGNAHIEELFQFAEVFENICTSTRELVDQVGSKDRVVLLRWKGPENGLNELVILQEVITLISL